MKVLLEEKLIDKSIQDKIGSQNNTLQISNIFATAGPLKDDGGGVCDGIAGPESSALETAALSPSLLPAKWGWNDGLVE